MHCCSVTVPRASHSLLLNTNNEYERTLNGMSRIAMRHGSRLCHLGNGLVSVGSGKAIRGHQHRRHSIVVGAQHGLQDRPRFAVVGAGLAGIAVTWHLLRGSIERNDAFPIALDVYCRGNGIADEASGAAAGLLHPLTPRGRPVWRALDAWGAALELVEAAEKASKRDAHPKAVWRKGILRLAQSKEQGKDLQRAAARSPMSDLKLQYLSPSELRRLVPGCDSSFGALMIGAGISLDPRRYLSALWGDIQSMAHATGSRVSLHTGMHFQSLKEIIQNVGGTNAAGIALCVGAGLADFEDLELPSLWLDFVSGTTISLVSATEQHHYSAPSIAAMPYIASHGPGRCVSGATWVRPTVPDQNTGGAPKTEAELLQQARRIWPPLRDWSVEQVANGMRAVAKRTHEGTVPYAGCMPPGGLLDEGMPNNVWLVAGLGSRGLLYHAWLGKLVAQGMVDRSEMHLPKQLLRWKE